MAARTTYKVTYNGIELNRISKVTELSQSTVKSDDGSQILYTHVVLAVQCVLNNHVEGFTASTIADWRKRLLQPRKALKFEVTYDEEGSPQTDTIIDIDGRDATNGPMPDELNMVTIIGDTILVSFKVSTDLVECESGADHGEIMYNRWSESVDVDEDGLSTVTTTGKLILNGTGANDLSADSYRDKILPVKNRRKGFSRTSARFTLSSDGRTLDYVITEKEKYLPPTAKITRWGGTWRESANFQGSSDTCIPQGTFSAWATAPKNIPKEDILFWLVEVAADRIDWENNFIRSYDISETLEENRVDVSINVMIPGKNNVKTMVLQTKLGKKLKIAGETQSEQNIRGSALVRLTSQKLFGTPCDNVLEIDVAQAGTGNAEQTKTGEGADSQPSSSASQTRSTNALTTKHIKHPYLYYNLEMAIDTNTGTIGPLPLLSSSNVEAQFCHVHHPVSKKIIKFSCERVGDTPELPDTIDDSSHVLLTTRIISCNAALLPDGRTELHAMSGEMVYGLKNDFTFGKSSLVIPRTPIEARVSTSIANLTASNFTDTLLA